jgi:predicted PurR-regulated permease PerM
MVAALDAMTGGIESAFRSFVPLVLAVLLALLLATAMSFFKKKMNKKLLNNKVIAESSNVAK